PRCSPMDVEQLWAERVVVAAPIGIHCVQRTRSTGGYFEVKTDRLPTDETRLTRPAPQRPDLTPRRPLRRQAAQQSIEETWRRVISSRPAEACPCQGHRPVRRGESRSHGPWVTT